MCARHIGRVRADETKYILYYIHGSNGSFVGGGRVRPIFKIIGFIHFFFSNSNDYARETIVTPSLRMYTYETRLHYRFPPPPAAGIYRVSDGPSALVYENKIWNACDENPLRQRP